MTYNNEIKAGMKKDLIGNKTVFFAELPEEFFIQQLPVAIFERTVEIIAQRIAEEVISKQGTKIMKSISPEAIANMAIAEAGAAINKTLKEKLPDKGVEMMRRETEVWQRGFFGGIKRIR